MEGSVRGLSFWDVFLGNAVAVGGFYSIGIFVVPFVEEFELSNRGTAAAIGSFCAVGFLGFGPFAGRIADRMGSRKCVLIGTVIASTAYLVASFLNNIYAIWLVYGVFTGLGGSFLFFASAPLPRIGLSNVGGSQLELLSPVVDWEMRSSHSCYRG